jgi:hypothetical protein
MHDKTITLELLRQHPALHRQLQSSGTLRQTIEHYAAMLKEHHLTWMDTLARQRPGRDPSQLSSQALERALQDLRDALPADSTPNAAAVEDPLSLDAAMTYLRRHTPNAS